MINYFERLNLFQNNCKRNHIKPVYLSMLKSFILTYQLKTHGYFIEKKK